MIPYDPKNWLRILIDFPKSPIFATMGLELLATEIEEPFGTDRNDLPLDDLAVIIERDVHQLLGTAA